MLIISTLVLYGGQVAEALSGALTSGGAAAAAGEKEAKQPGEKSPGQKDGRGEGDDGATAEG